jgi:hypothetical protein
MDLSIYLICVQGTLTVILDVKLTESRLRTIHSQTQQLSTLTEKIPSFRIQYIQGILNRMSIVFLFDCFLLSNFEIGVFLGS